MSTFQTISQSKLGLHSKISAVNILQFDSPASSVEIPEGYFFVGAAAGKAALASTTPASNLTVFLNWLNTQEESVSNAQGDPLDASGDFSATLTSDVSTGGVAGLVGSNTPVSLLISEVEGGASAVLGDRIGTDTSTAGKPLRIASGSIGTTRHYGIIYRIDASRIYILFNSNGMVE